MTQQSLERQEAVAGNAEAAALNGHRFTPKASFIGDIMSGGEIVVKSPEGLPGRKKFEVLYAEVGSQDERNFPKKLALALTLLDHPDFDRRFPRPGFLLRDFVPNGVEATPQIEATKDILRQKMVGRGYVDPKGREGAEYLRDTFDRHQNLQELKDSGWVNEVMGSMIAIVDFFDRATPTQKAEELRSWTTRALLRPYLGILTGKRPVLELSMGDMVDRVPTKVFDDAYRVQATLVLNYLEQRLAKSVTDAGLNPGLAELEHVVAEQTDLSKKAFLQTVLNRFEDIATFPLGDAFKDKIQVKSAEFSFPSFEQRSFAYGMITDGTKFLTADTGLGKTAAAYLAVENSPATKVLVAAVAFGKETWESEEKVVFKKPGRVFTINGSQDLDSQRLLLGDYKYIVISQDLLSRAESQEGLMHKLQEVLVDRLKIDGAIIDEIDNLRNADTIGSRVTWNLLEGIRRNHEEKGLPKKERAPIIGMTATAIRTGLEDLDVPMAKLYPEDYAMPGMATRDKKTFSDKCLGRPELVYSTLVGERRMYRWESATGVQELEYNVEHLEPSPFEAYLYDFIVREAPTNALNKIRFLEDMLLNPILVKGEIRQIAWKSIPQLDIDEAIEELKLVASRWMKLRGVESPQSNEDYLSADALVEFGKGDLVLAAFFESAIENGIDTFVEEMTRGSLDPDLMNLRRFWKPRELSGKYERLKQLMEGALVWRENPDGTMSRSKVMVISPARMQGRTGNVKQREISATETSTMNLYANYELNWINEEILARLLKKWFPEERVLLIDGTVTVGGPRNTVINRWVNEPDAAILLTTLEASYQSRDFTLSEVIDKQGRIISGVKKIFLGFPWYYQQFRQMAGRSLRQGMLVPVDIDVLMADGTIDAGKFEAVHMTYLLTRMALSGIQLTTEEQEFLDSKRMENRIPMLSEEARFRINVFSKVRGAGEDANIEFFNTVDDEGNLMGTKFASLFLGEGRDEFKTTGYNAEMVAGIVDDLELTEGKILSVGAGTLLLQRKLKRGIDNVDLNGAMMESGWEYAGQYGGNKIIGRASKLGEVVELGAYDFVDLAFVLHWTKLNGKSGDNERVKILENLNLAIKDGGYVAITLPEQALDNDIFANYVQTLENHFGLEVVATQSGRSYGVSKLGFKRKLGWCLVARKVGSCDLEDLDTKSLELNYDKREWVNVYQEVEKKTSGREYPSSGVRLSFDDYEIVNPLVDDEVLIIDQVDRFALEGGFSLGDETGTVDPTIEDTVIDGDILEGIQGTSPEEYVVYRKGLVNRLMRATGWSWAKTENFIRGITGKLYSENITRSKFRLFGFIIREAKKEQGKEAN